LADYPDFEGGKVALYTIAEWAAFEGKAIALENSGANIATGVAIFRNHTVPPGVTLYVNEVCFWCYAFLAADRDNNQMCSFLITRTVPGPITHYLPIGGNGGGQATLPRPLIFTTGQQLRVDLTNRANHNCSLAFVVTGYEI